jgi:hypothetical protein
MERRRVLWGLAALAATGIHLPRDARADDGPGLRVDVSLGTEPPERVLAILRELDATNIEQIKERGLGGTETVVAGILLAKGLANLIVRLLTMWQCGVVVDARTSRISTERNCDLPKGTVLVIDPGGVRSTIARPSAAQLQSLVDKFPAVK